MSTINNNFNALLELQALAAKNKQTSTTDDAAKKNTADGNTQTKSFADVWRNVQEKQKEWDQLMDKIDLAQYELALADKFWSSQADSGKHLRSYVQRHQKQLTQKNLADVTTAVAHLQQLNTALNGNIDPKLAKELESKLQSAMNDIIASSIKFNY